MYKTTCRVCGNDRLNSVINLGLSPLANNLLSSADAPCEKYPLEMMWCPECFNCQLSVVVPAKEMFDNYLYVSSTSVSFRKHFEDAAVQYIQEFDLDSDSVVWDIGSNDGISLKPLQQRGIVVCGIEPAANLAKLANDRGIPTVHGYFTQVIAEKAFDITGAPDIITASNVFAHADDLAGITNTVFDNLKPDGIFIVEVQYLLDTMKDLTFDNIYHEHVNYWSVISMVKFFDLLGYYMFHVEHIDTHGGSIRCFVRRTVDREENGEVSRTESVQDFLTEEGIRGVHDYGTYQQFRERVDCIRYNARRNMTMLTHIFTSICGYGSPAKATTALNYFGITSKDIMYTIDDNTLKNAKWIPGTGIQIWEQDDMYKVAEHFPEVCIVFAWNFFESIKAKLSPGIECISIKDLQLPPIEFAKLLSERYTQDTQVGDKSRYIVDTEDFSYKLVVGTYWKDLYHQQSISVILDCYKDMLGLINKVDKHRYIVDIGANCGILSVPTALSGYKVLAFDPALVNIESLELAVSQNVIQDKLLVFQYALSDESKQTEVYVPTCPDNSAMDSDTAIVNMESKEFTIESVQSITFDNWISEHPEYSDIGLIKIDVQGHEQQVIKGMSNFLQNCHDVYIICEFDSSVGEGLDKLYTMILSYGFTELDPITNDDKVFQKT